MATHFTLYHNVDSSQQALNVLWHKTATSQRYIVIHFTLSWVSLGGQELTSHTPNTRHSIPAFHKHPISFKQQHAITCKQDVGMLKYASTQDVGMAFRSLHLVWMHGHPYILAHFLEMFLVHRYAWCWLMLNDWPGPAWKGRGQC